MDPTGLIVGVLFGAVLFLSGLAGLSYETSWTQQWKPGKPGNPGK